MFGDNLSFVSDTTIAATRTQGVQLKERRNYHSPVTKYKTVRH